MHVVLPGKLLDNKGRCAVSHRNEVHTGEVVDTQEETRSIFNHELNSIPIEWKYDASFSNHMICSWVLKTDSPLNKN